MVEKGQFIWSWDFLNFLKANTFITAPLFFQRLLRFSRSDKHHVIAREAQRSEAILFHAYQLFILRLLRKHAATDFLSLREESSGTKQSSLSNNPSNSYQCYHNHHENQ